MAFSKQVYTNTSEGTTYMALSHNVNINITVINILFEGKLMNKYEDKGLKKKAQKKNK